MTALLIFGWIIIVCAPIGMYLLGLRHGSDATIKILKQRGRLK